MSTNAGPLYREAEARYRVAVTREEKLAALEEMLREIPKHKGTEKLVADLRTRLSKLKKEPQSRKGGTRGGPSHKIVHEGAGQVALVGPPNSGKSTLVAKLTHAHPDVAPFPMTTFRATPGMMPFEDVAFQLVDLPPVCHEHVEPWVYDIIRGADLVWWVLSIEHPLVGMEDTESLLASKAIGLLPPGLPRPSDPRPGWIYKDALMVVTGMDLPNAVDDLEAFEELMDRPWPRVALSGETLDGVGALGPATYDALGVMRVYTKEPGKDPDREKPFTLRIGDTVADLAQRIHNEIADDFRYARLWGPSAHDGQSVGGGHVLAEGDVVEIHR
jgi:ribosome-interacting GTPase 1